TAGSPAAPTSEPEEPGTELTTLADTEDEEPVDESTPEIPARVVAEDEATEEGSDAGDQLPTLPDPNDPDSNDPEDPEPADTVAPVTSWQLAPPAVVKAGATVPIRLRAQGEVDGSLIDKTIYLDGTQIGNSAFAHRNFDFRLNTTGLAEGVHVLRGTAEDEAGNSAEAIVAFVIDGSGPTITVKPGSIGAGAVFSNLDLKLFDANKVDYVVVNGVTKNLTDNNWSDVNDIVLGSFGIQNGVPFTVVAYDVAGNSTTATFTIDASGPTITVKPESVGGPSYYSNLDLKLHDAFQIDKAVINGWTKDLTNDQWSDVNDITIGSYGIQDGVPFTVVAYDVAGNATTATFTLDGTAPRVSWQVLPESLQSGSEHWRFITSGEPLQFLNKVTLIDGNEWDAFTSTHRNRDIVIDTTLLSDGVHTAQGVVYDEAGNRGETAIITFTVDNSGPQISVKPESVGGPSYYSTLSLKLHDPNLVDKVSVNGVLKDLTNNPWSDVNGITIGSFGIQDGVPFTVVAHDVLGNTTSATFTLDGTSPTVSWQVLPQALQSGDEHWRFIVTGELVQLFNKVTYIDGGVWDAFTSTHVNRDIVVDTKLLSDGVHTAQGVVYDEAGNVGSTPIVTFTVDNSGPAVTKKPESTKLSLSLKLYDPSNVAYATVNGVMWELTDNQWSDLNGITVGNYGIEKNVPFLVQVYDVLGNVTVGEYTLTATGGGVPFEPVG
ncbi:Ig-like domain repeat protein, partial [Pseudolysinimonas sp.]|uniref:Ig-like domain repeat protein n=1 Tax=Pseudolysinimonas sp. TaxID=2680009 RepID=UPI003784E11E